MTIRFIAWTAREIKLPYGRDVGRGIGSSGVSFLKHLWPIKYLNEDVQQTFGYSLESRLET